jgi:hypothetical protein
MKRYFIYITVIILFAAAGGINDLSASGSRAAYTRGGWAGAKYAAMGMSADTLVNDAYAIYWNPAGLSELIGTKKLSSDEIKEKAQKGNLSALSEADLLRFSEDDVEEFHFQVAVSAAMLDYDRNAGFAGVAFSAFSGIAGMGLYTLSSTGIEGRDETGAYTGDLSYLASTGYLSYAWTSGMTNIGFSLKGLYEKIDDAAYSGSGLDIGVQVSVLPFMKLGFVIQDLGTFMYPVSAGPEVEKRPDFAYTTFRLGGAVVSDSGLTLVFGVDKRLEQESYIVGFGVQYELSEGIELYSGMRDKLFSAGVGFNLWIFDVAYAMSFDSIDYGFNNMVSLLMTF